MRTFLTAEYDRYNHCHRERIFGTDNLVADLEGRFSNADETTPPKFWDLKCP